MLFKIIKKKYNKLVAKSPSRWDYKLIIYQIKKHGFFNLIKGNYNNDYFYEEYNLLRTQYQILAEFIHKVFTPKSVCDFGCGNAFLLYYLYNLGTRDIMGIDTSPSIKKHVDKSILPFIKIDTLSKPINIGKYELVISTEVAEHISYRKSDIFVQNLTDASSNFIFFTAAAPGQWGDHHINCQPKDYWIRKIQNFGFLYSEDRTISFLKLLKKNEFDKTKELFWIENNLLIFERNHI